MDAGLFLRDLEEKPASLLRLADELASADPFGALSPYPRRVLILGMGSSRYAARVAALRLRVAGVDAWAEYASVEASLPPRPDTLVVAISASGGSRETVEAVSRYRGRAPIVALTNTDEPAPVADGADLTVPMLAGAELGGVACRSFAHTLALLLALNERLTGGGGPAPGGPTPDGQIPGGQIPGGPTLGGPIPGGPTSGGPIPGGPIPGGPIHGGPTLGGSTLGGVEAGGSKSVAELCRRAAAATAHLLDTRGDWLPMALELLDGPGGVFTVAPAERISSAEQSALMVREGPRRRADATETGDWAHVDVYLTKTLDYRALLFPGSRYDEQAMEWIRQRGSTVLAVGAPVEGAAATIRYPYDDDPDVRLLTETLVAELVAATWWA